MGSYRIAVSTKYIMTRTTAHFNGISNPSNQSILFLSISCSSWCNLLYTHPDRKCQDPGQNKMAEFSHSPDEIRELFPGAPVRPVARTKNRRKRYFYIGEFGSLSAARRAPSQGTYPQLIHRLYTIGEFGSFTQIPLGV